MPMIACPCCATVRCDFAPSGFAEISLHRTHCLPQFLCLVLRPYHSMAAVVLGYEAIHRVDEFAEPNLKLTFFHFPPLRGGCLFAMVRAHQNPLLQVHPAELFGNRLSRAASVYRLSLQKAGAGEYHTQGEFGHRSSTSPLPRTL